MSGNRAVLGLGIGALALAVLVGSKIFAQGEAATYVGDKKCKKCHLKEHKEWSAKPHAKAFEVLKAEDMGKTDDETKKACVACHTTGHGKASGFVDKDKTPELVGVGCESCHGPGSAHASQEKDALKKTAEAKGDLKILKADAASCVFCHNPHVSFKEKYGKK